MFLVLIHTFRSIKRDHPLSKMTPEKPFQRLVPDNKMPGALLMSLKITKGKVYLGNIMIPLSVLLALPRHKLKHYYSRTSMLPFHACYRAQLENDPAIEDVFVIHGMISVN